MKNSSERILVLAASHRDMDSTCHVLSQAGMDCVKCYSPKEFLDRLEEGAGAVVLAKEILNPKLIATLSNFIRNQPTWSFLPIIILIGTGDLAHGNRDTLELLEPLSNTTLLERPVRIGTLVSVVKSALSDRRRQYEVKDLLTALENSKQEAITANQTKSLFLANMSHEIRSPLGAIMGFADLLKAPDLSKESAADYISVIDRNSNQLLRIIDDILDLTKVEAGKMQIEKVDFSLIELLADFQSIMEFKAKDKGIAFETRFITPVPEVICTDPTRLRQILTNVVGNALKFTEHGFVQLSVSYRDSQLEFMVTDTGIGISQEQSEKLFQPFHQADISTTRKFGGTGLGLILTRKLCENLGGEFHLVESKLNQGSVFKATIRAAVKRETKLLHKTSLTEKNFENQKEVNKFKNILKGMRILVVEDSLDNQTLFNLILSSAGAEVHLANDGKEGVNLALKNSYDVILMDVQMPHMDGHEATQYLRDRGLQLPIIALTAHAMKEERLRAQKSGFSDFLAKPFSRIGLLELLKSYRH